MIGEQVTWHRAATAGLDEYGEPLPATWTDVAVPGVAVAPSESVETRDQSQDTVTRGFDLYIRGLLEPSPLDEWTVRGRRARQVGEAAIWVSPFTGLVAGTRIRVKGI